MNTAHDEPSGASSVAMGEALERVLELAALLSDHMAEGMAERRLTRSRAELLWQLHRLGPVTQRRLSDALRVTPRNVTALLDALEAAGYVERGPHPTDRRASLVTLTATGQEIAYRMQAEYQRWADELFGDLPTANLMGFVDILDHLMKRIRASARD